MAIGGQIMKKVSIKIGYELACAFDKWIESELASDADKKQNAKKRQCIGREISYADACVIATVSSWRASKLHPKTLWYVQTVSLKLDAPSALALASFIQSRPLSPASYLGNGMLKITSVIDQNFQ